MPFLCSCIKMMSDNGNLCGPFIAGSPQELTYSNPYHMVNTLHLPVRYNTQPRMPQTSSYPDTQTLPRKENTPSVLSPPNMTLPHSTRDLGILKDTCDRRDTWCILSYHFLQTDQDCILRGSWYLRWDRRSHLGILHKIQSQEWSCRCLDHNSGKKYNIIFKSY